ncbi:MAG: hypothetical protein HY784_08170 [Chloroflexi bacterium]|nr:hypothetical protein [Chloroflexota bacterium]
MQPPIPFPAALVRLGDHSLLHLNPDAGPVLPRLFGPPVYLRHAFRFAAGDRLLFPHTACDDNGYP